MNGPIRITCLHAHRLLSERLDRPLGGGERWRLWLHLKLCEMCSRFERQMAFLRAAVRRLGE
ncbi:MAG TPA: anti-sigma factor [Burkholderiaceae bacterium]|nr:anti-sigma factor [Burkholderiaceae bacterium]